MNTYMILFWALFGLTLLIFIVNSVFNPIISKKMAKKAEISQEQSIAKIKSGNKVMLVSGIYGTIKKVHKKDFEVEIAKNVIIKVDKQGVMGYYGKKPEIK